MVKGTTQRVVVVRAKGGAGVTGLCWVLSVLL